MTLKRRLYVVAQGHIEAESLVRSTPWGDGIRVVSVFAFQPLMVVGQLRRKHDRLYQCDAIFDQRP